MPARLIHLTLASEGRRTLATSNDVLRLIVRGLLRPCRGRALLFGVVDEHGHLVAEAERPRLLARDVVRSVRRVLPDARFQQPHITEVESREHLERLVSYVLRQPAHHDLPVHPAAWEGTCFADLVGARLLADYEPSILMRELPRLRLRSIFPEVGLPSKPVAPASDEALRYAGVARLSELAASVYAVPTDLAGLDRDVVAARALVAHVATEVGFPPGEVARFLRLTGRGLRSLRQRPSDRRAARALRRRLTLETVVAARPSPATQKPVR